MDSVEGMVNDVDPELSDNNEGDGDILGGRVIEGGAVGALEETGSPRSFMTAKILLKSVSLWNLS